MKQLLYTILLTVCYTFALQAQTFTEANFKPLHGLVGTWKMETARGSLFETWQLSSAHQLAGKSFRIRNTDTVLLEQVDLSFKDGNILYIPVVRGQNNEQPVIFRLISNTGDQYIFENKEHDYPQRVIYKIVSKDAVHARIEGTKNGKAMSSDFIYSRVQ
jgi:hypothetical protein